MKYTKIVDSVEDGFANGSEVVVNLEDSSLHI